MKADTLARIEGVDDHFGVRVTAKWVRMLDDCTKQPPTDPEPFRSGSATYQEWLFSGYFSKPITDLDLPLSSPRRRLGERTMIPARAHWIATTPAKR